MRAGAAMVLALAGCASDLPLEALVFACRSDADCALGKVCDPVRLICADTVADAGVAGDAGVAAGADAGPACTPIACTAPMCGSVPDGCGRNLACGSCGPRYACGADNRCHDQICWSRPTPFPDINTGSEAWGFPFEEGSTTWLYFATNRYEGSRRLSYTALARVRLTSPIATASTTVERIHPPAAGERGWDGEATIRADGLEMFLTTSRPDARWEDREIYLSTRPDVSSRWGARVPLERLGSTRVDDDPVSDPLLLPDGRTLLYRQDGRIESLIARRGSSTAGDTSFEPAGTIVIETSTAAPLLHAPAPSCDGRHLLYVRERPRAGAESETRARIAPIESFDPLRIGEPRDYPAAIAPGTGQRRILRIFESADCNTLYLSDYSEQYYARRVPCP